VSLIVIDCQYQSIAIGKLISDVDIYPLTMPGKLELSRLCGRERARTGLE